MLRYNKLEILFSVASVWIENDQRAMQICLRNRARIVGLLTIENIYISARFNFGTVCKAHVPQTRTKTHRHIKTAIKIIYVRRRRVGVLRPREICILSFVAFVCSIIVCRKRRVDVLHYDLPQNSTTTGSLLPLYVQ